MAQVNTYSTKRISKSLIEELVHSIKSVERYGSVEIFVQDSTVTQITVRSIRKTKSKEEKAQAKK